MQRWAVGPWMIHALALALYVLVAAAAMGALVANLSTAVPGGHDSDYYQTHWSLWWVRYALSRDWDPMFTDWVLYPLRHNLSIHMLTPSLVPAYMALEPVFGRVAAVNLINVAIVALSAYAMFAFLRGHLRQRGPSWADDALALVGGFVFGFLPYEINHAANSHLNLTPIFWMPLALWLWDRAALGDASRRRWLWAAALGVALWGAWLTDLQYLMWIPLLGGVYAVYLFLCADGRRARVELLALGMFALAVMLALGAIAPLPAMLQVDSGDFIAADLRTPRAASMRLGALLLSPGEGDGGFGRWLVILTVGGVLLAPILRRGEGKRDAERWIWLLAAIIPFVLALGPDIEIGGRLVPLPYRILHDLMNGQYRNPVRFAVPGVFALIVFCALAWRPLAARVRRPVLRAGLTAAALIAFALDFGVIAPFPVRFPPDYATYHEIGAEPGDYVILEVPVGVHSGWTGMGDGGQYLMYYAPDHAKRLVNGTLSRIPWQDHYVYFESPLLSWLAGTAPLDTQAVPRELAKAVEEWPVGYVIVHPDMLTPTQAAEFTGVLNTQASICFYKAQEGLLLYRAAWHPGGCPPRTPPQDAAGAYVIDFGAPGDAPFIGEYWYAHEDVGGVAARWAGGNDASRLRVELPPGRAYAMALTATGYGEGRAVQVTANGVALGGCDLPGGWTTCVVALPEDVVGGGDLLIVLSHGQPVSAAARGESADTRTLTAAYDRIVFQAVGP